MEFKGTKGKWNLKVHDDMYNAFILNNQILPTKYKEEEYNAKLMETAHEMLEMLQSCVNLLERMNPEENSKCDFKIQEIKQLIKKATTL